MQSTPLLAVAGVLAAATSFATVQLLAPPSPPAAPLADPEVATLRQEVTDLQQKLAELRRAPAPVEAAASQPQRVAVPQVTDEQIDQALVRYFAAHGGAAAPSGDGEAGAPIDLAKVRADLRGKSNYWNNTELYKRLFAAGRMDELIGDLEQFAEQNPKDAQAQLDLGNAYLAHLQMDNTKWQLSMKADASFDKVLAIDDKHWEARFTKAMSYTFWPDFLGKKKEAIAHFEQLVEQQAQMPPRPEFANTYLFLGNILEQRGETDRAREIWERGIRLHPEDAGLRGKLGR